MMGYRISGRPPLAAASAGVGAVATVVYAGLRAAEGAGSVLQSLGWLVVMVLAVASAASSLLVKRPRGARRLLAVALVLFALLGVANVYGVGIGFLLAAILAGVALGSRSDTSKAAANHSLN